MKLIRNLEIGLSITASYNNNSKIQELAFKNIETNISSP